ncbi:MFS transporter [Streptomyces vastus]|uniref:Major facilitator superfamily (MFS) profile domain-containing protein n=1 Tax=Streptomyces vastus TaxID=285451 RepID=A0ABN3RH00_9ACTN
MYGTAAALVLGPAFFPSGNATASSLAAFLTFAAAFLSRPLGVVLFGTIGDRLGRRQTLVTSLLLMGVATVGVGLLPTYETAGLLAPVLLVTLRLLQGLSMGGEWGGAVLLAAEHAPLGRRAMYAAIPNVGPSLGFLLSSAVILPTLHIACRDGFTNGAWRIPFLLSTVLVVIGLWVRATVSESPVFNAPARRTAQAPASRFLLGALLRQHPGRLLLGLVGPHRGEDGPAGLTLNMAGEACPAEVVAVFTDRAVIAVLAAELGLDPVGRGRRAAGARRVGGDQVADRFGGEKPLAWHRSARLGAPPRVPSR